MTLPQITKLMCEIIFKKIDHVDYKIIAFKVKKRVFLYATNQGQQTLKLLGFTHKIR
jgi:hypothetical protein